MGPHITRAQVVAIIAMLAGACTKDVEMNGDGEPGDGDGDGDPSGDGDGDGDGGPGDGDGGPGDGDGGPGDGDGGPGDGDGGPGDGDGDGGPLECSELYAEFIYTPPELMFMVDASGSMVSDTWDHDGDAMTPQVTRWSSLHNVIAASMTQFDTALVAGLQRFPAQDACNCYDAQACTTAGVPEATLALGNAATMLAAIPGSNAGNLEIVGATPTGRAFDSVLAHLLEQPSAGESYIFLLTDGAANCNAALTFPDLLEIYDDTLLTKVESARLDDGVTTVVFGVDIDNYLTGIGADAEAATNPYARLNELALAGGAPKNMGQGAEHFYNAGDETQLLDAMLTVLDELASCTIDLTTLEPPPHPTQSPFVIIEVDGMQVPMLDQCDMGDGWAWLELGLSLQFCGSVCQQFRAGAAIHGFIGCPSPG